MYVSYLGDSLGMGIGAGNSTSRRGSRVAGKKNIQILILILRYYLSV